MSTPRIPALVIGADTCGVGQEESCLGYIPRVMHDGGSTVGYHYSLSATRATIILHDESDDENDAK